MTEVSTMLAGGQVEVWVDEEVWVDGVVRDAVSVDEVGSGSVGRVLSII